MPSTAPYMSGFIEDPGFWPAISERGLTQFRVPRRSTMPKLPRMPGDPTVMSAKRPRVERRRPLPRRAFLAADQDDGRGFHVGVG
jgi:hypothetical protein